VIPLFTSKMPTQTTAFTKTDKLVQDAFYFLQTLWNRTGDLDGIAIEVATALTATGTSQASALALSVDWNEVTTVDAGTGVILASGMQPGQVQRVFNGGLHALNVFPPKGSKINSLAINAAFSLAATKTQDFCVYSSTQIRTVSLG